MLFGGFTRGYRNQRLIPPRGDAAVWIAAGFLVNARRNTRLIRPVASKCSSHTISPSFVSASLAEERQIAPSVAAKSAVLGGLTTPLPPKDRLAIGYVAAALARNSGSIGLTCLTSEPGVSASRSRPRRR